MKGIAFISAWSLIFLAASYDGYFAWNNREDMASWELNPLARWILHHCGLESLLTVKGSGLIFAIAVAVYCRQRRSLLAMSLTMIVACCYFLLSLHYFVGTDINLPSLSSEASASAIFQ